MPPTISYSTFLAFGTFGDAYQHHRVSEVILVFAPCSRTELSWSITARAHNGHTLTVEDILHTITISLFHRHTPSNPLPRNHPCRAFWEDSRLLRVLHGHHDVHGAGGVTHGDRLRNVDLYHADRGRALYFRGIRPEQRPGSDVVYVVDLQQE
ncbi:uncharacterized protein BXZ73DRAFT_105601 [Epithele typhae]|uniref:uncharacterized protein n=1 Tax=Epithele typhae TaxID=378194 RepID=UPI0020073B58|nr:uncharacterized protein BXZ73DRAFT_105601 [Epithele typhae]KAH9917127.1 hypothetical protein BXZ73DRAFT_105601 [Epithele typhae]